MAAQAPVAASRVRVRVPASSANLGPGFDVQPPAQRGRQAESLLAGYNVMVSISSAFALFIGMFIIYNSF